MHKDIRHMCMCLGKERRGGVRLREREREDGVNDFTEQEEQSREVGGRQETKERNEVKRKGGKEGGRERGHARED